MNLKHIFAIMSTVILLTGVGMGNKGTEVANTPAPAVNEVSAGVDPVPATAPADTFNYSQIPEYSGEPSVPVHNNQPFFTEIERAWSPGLEYYSPLDEFGRCGETYAVVGREIMPAYGEQRGEIGMIKPSGWQTVKYPDVIEDRFLYNRCHLIGWQLGNENANPQNLITGTRYLNVEGMLPYENMVADYVHRTKYHVLYRVTPYFDGDDLVARGVLIEAESVEDKTIQFCVWCYNVQPCIEIDYATGKSVQISHEAPVNQNTDANTTQVVTTPPTATQAPSSGMQQETQYILNTNTHKVHLPECDSVGKMSERNKRPFNGTVEELKEMGYTACGSCHPF